jgi:hypothetical protein
MRRDSRRVGVEDASLDSPRMPRMAVLLLSLMLGAGCAVLVSCGSDDSDGSGIPSDAATGMLNELNAARAALDEGDCAKVADSAQDIESAAQNLDTTVAEEVRTGLVDGAAHLAELANDPSQCEQTTTSTTSTTEKPKPEPETTSTTEPSTTEETTTTTTTSAEEEPAQPPEEPPGQPPGPPSGDEGTGAGGTGGTGDGKGAEGAKQPKKEKKEKAG